MRRLFLQLVLGSLTASVLSCQTAAPVAPKAQKLTPEEIKSLLAQKKVVILDVRQPKELEESGALRGYVNIPITELEGRLSELSKQTPVFTYCARGVRAGRAAAILENNGYQVVGLGALAEWKDKGYDVVYPKSGTDGGTRENKPGHHQN